MQGGIDLFIAESAGIPRFNEPVTAGVPLGKGLLPGGHASFALFDDSGKPVPVQTQVLDRWSDGSVRWLLLDFQVTLGANTEAVLVLRPGCGVTPERPIKTDTSADTITVGTNQAVFRVDSRRFRPFTGVAVGGAEYITPERSETVLTDGACAELLPFVTSWRFETEGPLRKTLFMQGAFSRREETRNGPRSMHSVADFFARLHFYAGHSFTKIEFSIRNPRPAKHPGGMWDLGDEGSIFFKDLSVNIGILLTGQGPRGSIPEAFSASWKTRPRGKMEHALQKDIAIYQDSSGGDNWQSENHVNKDGVVTAAFSGYRVFDTGDGKILEEGDRANPVLFIGNAGKNQKIAGAALPKFWQNFPKALEARDNCLSVRLFPGRYRDIFELQGGEQKTHAFFLSFGSVADYDGLDWTHAPLVPRLAPEYYAKTGVFTYPGNPPSMPDAYAEYLSMMDGVIEGEKSFFARREIIDEYGWRNFGDLYADHENAYYSGQKPKPVISHYNNQYDALHGFLLQYARSGEPRWFELADDLARHVMDIDIYHTEKDKPAYNGGLFWHTDHYAGAATSTHRTYSRNTMTEKNLKDYGGGPSNEHNYTSGLLSYYFMTGDHMARESVIGLADWVINMDDGLKSRKPLRLLCAGPTGLASRTGAPDYHKAGRGCGNSINALLDGFRLTKNQKYLEKTEELIRRCINPNDDIDGLNLVADPEHRWYYTAFLQVLGKYLDFKSERAEHDYVFCYAREGLLRYAWWMAENEVPFKNMLGVVEYPTESWIVMDMRKSNVFNFAAEYETDDRRRGRFIEKADFFYKTCLEDLRDFETRTLTRPLVMLMSYGLMSGHFCHDAMGETGTARYDFGRPARFVPQRARAKRRLVAIGALCSVIGLVFLARWLFLA